ncbi:MAG: hypothetical protein ACPLRW_06730 [Moorellales bacterium]
MAAWWLRRRAEEASALLGAVVDAATPEEMLQALDRLEEAVYRLRAAVNSTVLLRRASR